MHGGVDHGSDRARAARQDGAGPLGPAPHPRSLPDVATDSVAIDAVPLDRVGMSGIQVMVRVADETGAAVALPARVDAAVSLDRADARGIHMSRLYLDLQARLEVERLDAALLAALLRDFLVSQQGLASRAEVRVRFELPLHRPALVSEHRGWRHYPVELRGVLDGERLRIEQAVTATYSSTCPCSAALSRQAVQEAFDVAFAAGAVLDRDAVRAWLRSEAGMSATPHAQRSTAELRVVPEDPARVPSLADLVDLIEDALATPVQTAVKREDEQAFAQRNGGNLMFCEDAARRLRRAVAGCAGLHDYRIRVDHHESLHPHDATAVMVKGVADGLRP